MSTDIGREAWMRRIARDEASERLEGEQRRIAAFFSAAGTPGRFVRRRVLRHDYLAAARELRKLMGK